MKPRIGVFPQYDRERRRWFLVEAYVRCIVAAGGEPYLVFSAEERTLQEGDGFVFPGGPDVNPLIFGQDAMQGCGDICPERDELELAALRRLAEMTKPVLGICRGIQVMNVALGGTLHQDMKELTRLQHYQVAANEVTTHEVLVEPGTLLRDVTGKEHFATNSFHHQCIDKPGDGLSVCGRTGDGVIEAVELAGHPFFVGVQWHPEHLAGDLFARFVESC